ncbi:N-acetylneuraminate synthase family protein [Nitrosopumilus sp.]|nr:N-acetylneuraminate synthase family protein [Nitrosopumilus sp.]
MKKINNLKPIAIGKHKVGNNNHCYIIAEIGSNFDGNINKAKKLIKLAKESGADCVKFQSFITEKLLSKTGFDKKSAFQAKWKKPVWQVYKDAEFPREWHKKLADYAKKIKIDFMSTPYDYEAVDLLEKIGVPAYKIGSGDVTFLEFLKYIAKKGKPVMLPTGASTIEEIKDAVTAIKSTKNNKIIILQSVTQYPSPIEQSNILAMVSLRKKFGFNVGYSDHSPNIAVPVASVANGACVIEKHFTDNKDNIGPDHPHSLNPQEFSYMVKLIRDVEKALGDGIKKIEKSEKETRIIQRRSVFAVKEIQKGEKFTKENIKCLRPAIGIDASKYSAVLNKKAKRNLKPFTAIKNLDF